MKVLISIILVLTSFTLSAGQWTNGSTGQIRINWRGNLTIDLSDSNNWSQMPTSAILHITITPYSVGSSACLNPQIDINGGANLRNEKVYRWSGNDYPNAYPISPVTDFYMITTGNAYSDVSKGAPTASMNNTSSTTVFASVPVYSGNKNFISTRGILNIFGNGCSAGMFDVSGSLSFTSSNAEIGGGTSRISVSQPITFSNNKF